MDKIIFTDNQAPAISASNLNQIQTNVENAINQLQTNTINGTVLYEDTTGTNGNVTFSSSITSANNIEIIYCRRRASTGTSVFKSTGKLPYSNGMEIALDINYYSTDTNQQSIAKIVTASSSGLTVSGENTLQGNEGGQAITSATTNIYITKVIIYK